MLIIPLVLFLLSAPDFFQARSRELNCLSHQMPNWLFETCENCDSFDIFCEVCLFRGPPVCLQCREGYFVFQGGCRWNKCSDRLPGCEICDTHEDDQVRCKRCSPGFVLNEHMCSECTKFVENCRDCKFINTTDVACQVCKDGYTLDGPISCINSSSVIVNCSLLASKPFDGYVCERCADGFSYDSKAKKCIFCEETSGVAGCSKCEPEEAAGGLITSKCLACAKNFHISANSSVCEPSIKNCSNYTDDGLCLACDKDLYLEMPSK